MPVEPFVSEKTVDEAASDPIEDDKPAVEAEDDKSEKPLSKSAADHEPDDSETEEKPAKKGREPKGRTADADGEDEPVVEPPAKPEVPTFESIRDIAKKRAGFDPAQWKDDESAAGEIVDGYKKYREMEPDYQLYQRMNPQFQAWLSNQSQQPPPPAAQEAKPSWFTPPEFKKEWLNDVETDDKGNLKPKEGSQITPDRLGKVANYIQWRREIQERLLSDPATAIQEMVAGQVEETARKLASEQISEMKLQHEAQAFVDKHSSWLFRLNEQNQRVIDPITKRHVLTQEGAAFSRHFADAERLGMRTLADMQEYALAMVERELLRQKVYDQPAEKPVVPAKTALKESLVKASRSPRRSASQANDTNAEKMAQNPKMDLESQMLAAFKEAGITDADLD